MIDTINIDNNGFLAESLQNDLWLWVSTVKPEHRPSLYPHWFVWTEEKIYLFLKEGSYDLANMRQTPAVACALEVVNLGEDVIVLDGRVEILRTDEVPDVFTAYLEKYDVVVQALKWNVEELPHKFPIAIRITPIRQLPWPPTDI